MDKFKIKFLPNNKSIEVDRETTILSAAISAGVYINSSCGGDGVCSRCKVIIKEGNVNSQPSGRITQDEKARGYVLSCQARVESNLIVEIPPESRLEEIKVTQESKELRLKGFYERAIDVERVEAALEEPIFKHSPLATKLYLQLPAPGLEDNISDLERLYREIRRIQDIDIMQTGLVNIRHLGKLLRSSDWKVTVTLGKRNGTTEIVLIEPGDTSGDNYGLAFDIGTTTISAQIVNLNTKKVLGTKATYNKQASFGSDVITRIICAEEPGCLEKLHHVVIDSMNEMIHEFVIDNNLDLNDINCLVCAGNPTMIHLLLRVDPTFIRREPYVPSANFVPVIRSAEVGIKINPRGLLSCIPGVASYVGGDITAGILACGMHKSDKLSLLIDIGTNGEIVLGNKEWLISAAASAGPAFEGSGVESGLRAMKGAIQEVEIEPKSLEVKYKTIGNEKPIGICGSGYIDALSELLKAGVIDKSGKIVVKHARVREKDNSKEFVLVFKDEAGIKKDIVITEDDLENLKRAKAAIYSAASVLIRHMDLKMNDLDRIFIAGGFGTYLNIKKAISIGLLPDFPMEKFLFIGNSSLFGAREVLLFSDAAIEVEEIAKKVTYLELSVDSKYMDEYMAALFFPHTDLAKFPSLKVTSNK